MTDLPSPIFQWLNQHPHLSGLFTFFISTMESVAIIGTIIPGSIMMTGIGALAGAGIIPLYPTILWAILGAIVGDGISYWAGRYFNTRLPYVWPFRSYPKLLEGGEQFFYRHGSMSVFIGRFVGPVRALVPMIAGMMGMPAIQFTIANVLSAIGWAPAYMLPGILIGAASLELPPDLTAHALLMLLMTGLGIILCTWSLIILLRIINRQIDHFLNRIWQWLKQSKPLHPLTTILKHHNVEKTHGQLILAFYIVCTISIFCILTLNVVLIGSKNLFINQFFYHLFRSLRSPEYDTFMLWASLAGQSSFLLPLILTLSGWLYWKKNFHTAHHVLLLGALSVTTISTLKWITHSVRPGGIFHVSPEFSFPSGHATLSVTFFFAIALLIGQTKNIRPRALLYWLAGLGVFTVSVSRLYLGAHWFTDILGGWLLAATLLMVTVLSWRRQKEQHLITCRSLLIVIFSTLLVSGSYTFERSFYVQKQNTQLIAEPIQMTNMQTWWNQIDNTLPLYRINRFGIARQILNLQWVGDPKDMNQTLLAQGWQIPAEITWIGILHRLSNIESTEHLPLVSPIYLGKKPVFVFTKHIQKKHGLVVLRLWQSNLKISSTALPLWVGTIEEVPPTYSWLQFRKLQSSLPLEGLLFMTKTAQWQVKTINKQLSPAYRPRERTLLLVRPTNNTH